MFLSRWKFDPRLLSIKAGNTRVAEGLHHVHGILTALDAQVKEARAKLPLESVPQAKLISEMNENSSQCARQTRALLDGVQECSSTVNAALDMLCKDLDQLDKLLTAMQNTGTELRSFSFDGVMQLLAHTNRGMTRLEKQALAENNRYFWPWALIFVVMIVLGAGSVFTPTASSMNLFGDASQLHRMVFELVGFLDFDLGLALLIHQIYLCFKPRSPGLKDPNPIYEVWGIAFGSIYTCWAGLMVWIWSFYLAVWISGNPHPDWWGFISLGGAVVMVISAIVFIADMCDPPK